MRVGGRSGIVVDANPQSICRHICGVPATSRRSEVGPRLSSRGVRVTITELHVLEVGRVGERGSQSLAFQRLTAYLTHGQCKYCRAAKAL